MAPRPEDSPVSTPRTRSPVKGVRTGGASCSGPNVMSMLTMLAEVASVTLHTDPSVTDNITYPKSKTNPPVSRKPSDFEILTLEQVTGMTDNLLVKLFAEFESNEMWKRFTYTCQMLPAACSKYFQSFGSEHKARAGMKVHLQSHLKNLLEIHANEESRQTYVLESIPARNRRLTEQDAVGGKRRTMPSSSRNGKSTGTPKVANQEGVPKVVNKEGVPKVKRAPTDGPKDHKIEGRTDASTLNIPPQSPATESKLKRKLESREGKVRIKKPKNGDGGSFAANDDCNNNNELKNNGQDVIEPSCTPPMQEIVSHDHGYLKASTSVKPDSLASKDHTVQGGSLTFKETPQPRSKSHLNQITTIEGDGSVDSCMNFCVKESPAEDRNTLLHQHMNQELEGGIMAQDSGSDATPLPVVGSEVEFTPDQQYKVMRSADLPVVYDHNNPATNVQTVSRIIERDEYKVRKKPKGRAKFIGQSKAEKEMALKLITEIRSQSVMVLDTLECKICHPPRLFTALSTLLSHYRSHAGIRPYECRICEAVFTRQHSLNYHMLIHTNQTRFTCVDCGRKFRHPSHFKEHRRRHTGESPYECSDCLMRFKTRNTYKRHLRTRHGKLLTTQGAIIILSQEEADRMKKTQGRKPRRPRQPLQIISPETAAQIEEEQIWTDFEEGDREDEEEEEDEDDEEDEEDDQSPLDLTKKPGHIKFDSQASPDAVLKTLGVQPRSNGKTGLVVRPTKVSVRKSDLIPNMGNFVDTNTVSKTVEVKKENVEYKEEFKEEAEEELRTYVFHPTPQHSSVPKVNVKSSWNTVNIDLKNLERAANPTPDDVMYTDKQTILEADQTNKITEQVTTILPTNCTEFVGDNINPEEVITICAGVDTGGKDMVLSPLVESQTGSSRVKPDWFTVKKPLKCYSRPGYSSVETVNTIFSSSSAIVPTNHVDSHGHGMYFIVQGQDGRLAKVYQGNGSIVNKPSQQQVAVQGTTTTTTIYKSNASSDSLPATSQVRTLSGNLIKSEVKHPRERGNAPCINTSISSSRVVFKPIKALTNRNIGLNSIGDNKVVVNKQVVNNVVVKNHIVQNGSLVKVKCEGRETLPLRSSSPLVSVVPVISSIHSSPIIVTSVAPVNKSVDLPPVIVTSVASIPNTVDSSSNVVVTTVAPNATSGNVTPMMLPPVSVQPSLPEIVTSMTCIPREISSGESVNKASQKTLLTWQGQPSSGNVLTECVNSPTTLVENEANGDHKAELNHLLYTEVDSLVTIGEDLLLENVEIIENLDSDSNMNVTVNGIIEKDGMVKLERQFNVGRTDIRDSPDLMPFSNSNVKVEATLDSRTQYMGHLIQDRLPIQAVSNGSDARDPSVLDALQIAQASHQHLRTPIRTVNHIVSIPPSTTLKI